MQEISRPEIETDAVDRYLAETGGVDSGDAAVFARCDAVIALVPRIGESSDIGWAYDEARRLARAAPRGTEPSASRPWYLSPVPAWSTAGVLAVALVVASLPRPPGEPPPEAGLAAGAAAPRVANITFAPIVISPDLAQTLAEIDPVVLLANETPVDARSLAVLPFSGRADAAGSPQAAEVADSIYGQVFRQLSATPGIYVIDPATAAVYAGSSLSPEEIALQLGVRGIVEGRVAAINGEIRFELRLTDAAAAGSSIDQAIERPTEELAMLQADIASTVIGALARTRTVEPANETP